MSLFRPPAAPQRIAPGVAALLATVAGFVPQGSNAATQALAAYRGPVNVEAQQPNPPTYTAIDAGNLIIGPTVPMGSTAAQQVLAYRGPQRIVEQPEPPTVVGTALAATIGPTAPAGDGAPVAQALAAYREAPRSSGVHEQERLLPFFHQGVAAVSLPYDPVVQIAAATWPYAAFSAIEAQPAATIPVPSYAPSPGIAQAVSAPPWTYAGVATTRSTSQVGIAAVYLGLAPVALPAAATWPYGAFAAIEAQPAATMPVGGYVGPTAPRIASPATWPYVIAAEASPLVQAVTTGPGAPAGSTATAQARIAYSPPPPAVAVHEQLRLGPEPATIAGVSEVYGGAPPVFVPATQVPPWPYATSRSLLVNATIGVGVGPATAYSVPRQIQPAAWPHSLIAARPIWLIAPAQAYVSPSPIPPWVREPWPFAALTYFAARMPPFAQPAGFRAQQSGERRPGDGASVRPASGFSARWRQGPSARPRGPSTRRR